MARTKQPKAGREPAGQVGKPKRQGRLMERGTDLVAVLFGLSLVAERLVLG